MSATVELFALVLLFLGGLAFAPGKELNERVRNAARFAVLAMAMAGVAWLLWARLAAA